MSGKLRETTAVGRLSGDPATNTLDPRLGETIRTRAHRARDQRVEAAARVAGGRRGGFVPDGPAAIYLLVSEAPPRAGTERGWTLMAYEGSDRCWSASLAGHGAAAGAARGEAQAAAERLLAGHGIRVVDWRAGQSDDGLTSRAAVRPRER